MKNFILKIAAFTLFIGALFFFIPAANTYAQPANITLTADSNVIRIDWEETSSDPVDDYTVEISSDGGSTWIPWPHPASSQTYLELPRSIAQNIAPIVFHFRITTEFSDSSSSAPVTAILTVPSIYQKSNFFTASAPSVTASDSYRKSLGLNYWIDGNIGIFKRNNEILTFSPNGPVVARTIKGSGGQLLGTLTDNNISIQNQTLASDYAAGGPVYYDEANDRLLLFYHGELHDPIEVNKFYGYIGMAVSYDGGETFDDLGEIIRPNIVIGDPDRTAPTEVGGAPYIIKDGYFYVYFKDMLDDGSVVNLAVARASVADVLSAAALGTTAAWQKYAGGSFNTPGLGGAPDNLIPGQPTAVWFDTAFIQSLNKYVMVYSNGYSAPSMHLITTSTDGIHWEDPELLYENFSPNEMSFVSISSPDFANQRVITGDHFYLFRTVSATAYSGFRWDDAWQETLTVSFPLSDNSGGGTQPDSNGQSNDDGLLASTGLSQVTLLYSAVTIVIAGVSLCWRSLSEQNQ